MISQATDMPAQKFQQFKFNNKNELFDPIKGAHQRLKCKECEYISFSIRVLDFHMNSKHSNQEHEKL